jgi:hypothetical protein
MDVGARHGIAHQRKEKGRRFVAHQEHVEIEAILYIVVRRRRESGGYAVLQQRQRTDLGIGCCLLQGRQANGRAAGNERDYCCDGKRFLRGLNTSIKRSSGRLQSGYVRTI